MRSQLWQNDFILPYISGGYARRMLLIEISVHRFGSVGLSHCLSTAHTFPKCIGGEIVCAIVVYKVQVNNQAREGSRGHICQYLEWFSRERLGWAVHVHPPRGFTQQGACLRARASKSGREQLFSVQTAAFRVGSKVWFGLFSTLQ